MISNVVNLVNKRPVAFQEVCRENEDENLPSPITPELLIHGYNLPTVNCVPALHSEETELDCDWNCSDATKKVRERFNKLRKVRKKLLDLYTEEFIAKLVDQAVDKDNRYIKRTHKSVEVGDVVLLTDKFAKPCHYPLGIVTEVTKNDLGEVTEVEVKKGGTGKIVRRHVTSVRLSLVLGKG